MENVVTIKRHQKQPYPDLWPKVGFNAVAYTLYRQLPIEAQNYYFAVKADIPGPVFSIIVQASKSVLYQMSSKNKSETMGFNRWFNLNLGTLRKLSDSGFSGTIVGKMSSVDERDIFCAYYIVRDNAVIVDVRSIDAELKLAELGFDETFLSMPVSKLATVHIDKVEEIIRSQDLLRGLSGAILGIPVTKVEPRTAEDGTEAAPPRLQSSAIHMRYMGFVQALEKAKT